MKTIATLIFVLFIGVTAMARTATEDVKVEVVEMTTKSKSTFKKVKLNSSFDVARLYKRYNTRVKKELAFYTKTNGSNKA